MPTRTIGDRAGVKPASTAPILEALAYISNNCIIFAVVEALRLRGLISKDKRYE
jgi:hypothetical protein